MREADKKTENRKIDPKATMQVVIDIEWHEWLKVKASEERKSIKKFLQEKLSDIVVEK